MIRNGLGPEIREISSTSLVAELLKAILALSHGVPLFHAGQELEVGDRGTGSGKPPGKWEGTLKSLKMCRAEVILKLQGGFCTDYFMCILFNS